MQTAGVCLLQICTCAAVFGMALQDQNNDTDNTNIVETIEDTAPQNNIIIEDAAPLNAPGTFIYTEVEKTPEVMQISPSDLIFVGDSRTVGMENAISPDATVIAKVGAGYDWLKSKAAAEIEAAITDSSVLIFNLGINDLGNVTGYIDYLQELQNNHPDLQIVYVTINPVGKTTITNEEIDEFNAQIMQAGLNVLDTNTWLKEEGFDTWDGLHYTEESSKAIYERIVRQLDLTAPHE